MKQEKSIKTLNEALQILENESATLFYFSTTSCSVGEAFEPKVKKMLLLKFPKINFYNIDLNLAPDIAAYFTAFVEPTILVFYEGKETIRKSRSIGIHELEIAIERPYKLIFE